MFSFIVLGITEMEICQKKKRRIIMTSGNRIKNKMLQYAMY